MNNFKNKTIFYFLQSDSGIHDQWQNFHFIDELGQFNILFEVFNPNDFLLDSLEIENLVFEKVKANREHISIFLASAFDRYLTETLLSSIRALGIPTVLMSFDDLSIPYKQKNIAKHFDVVWLTSYQNKYLYEQWGAKTIFLPYAANPFYFLPQWKSEIESVGFIGTIYGNRERRLKNLYDNRIPTQIFGKNLNAGKDHLSLDSIIRINTNRLKESINLMTFPVGRKCIIGSLKKHLLSKNNNFNKESFLESIHNGNVRFDHFNYLYSNFALSIGFTELWNTYTLCSPIHKIHLRTFEIPMCGGLQIAPYSEELGGYFESNKEIVFFSDESELIEKSKFYLSENKAGIRKEIKRNARVRCEKDHTWYNRFNQLHNVLY